MPSFWYYEKQDTILHTPEVTDSDAPTDRKAPLSILPNAYVFFEEISQRKWKLDSYGHLEPDHNPGVSSPPPKGVH